MAKKTTKKVEVEEPQLTAANEMTEVVVEEEKRKEPSYKKAEDGWEIKDRVYYLKGNKKPISRSIKSAGVYWFDEEKGYERELKYCENQRTSFVDEMKGDQRLSHILFRNGSLFVPKEKTVLQKLLSKYHPDRNKLYYEFKPAAIAENQIEILELEADAIIAA